MNISAHPNIHAVKFLCETLTIILEGNVPTLNQLQVSYITSLRGNALELTVPKQALETIGFDDLAEMFRTKLQREFGERTADVSPELITGFVMECSCRLDRVLGFEVPPSSAH